MQRKKISLLFFLIVICFVAFGQKESNIWYFGNYAGIDFNGDTVKAITDGALLSGEGCATMCDEDGNLLFYTNGITVWNSNHEIMLDGNNLAGNPSASQSSIIIPVPEDTSLYYIFTADCFGQSDGLQYSMVDITLDDGLGGISESSKLLCSPVSEKITAVQHENGTDFWLLAHGWKSDKFHAYLITADGIEDSVKTNIGIEHSGGEEDSTNAIGYMKFSSSGNRIALAVRDSCYQVFYFNMETGIIYDPVTITKPDSLGKLYYGVEFSKDGTILYGTDLNEEGYIYQYDLEAGTEDDINNSMTIIGTTGNINGALQMGIDSVIYVARNNQQYLGAISLPEEPGTGCNYVNDSIFLDSLCYLGLPNFVPISSESFDFYYTGVCYSYTTSFFVTDTTYDTYEWTFNDGAQSPFDESDLKNPEFTFSSVGTYTVQLIATKDGEADTVTNEVTIYIPTVDIGDEEELCEGDTLVLDPGDWAEYYWQDASTDSTCNVVMAGLYSVKVIDSNGCEAADSVEVVTITEMLTLGNDTTICEGTRIELDAGSGFITYLWQDNSTNQTLTTYTAGIYKVEVEGKCGIQTDSVEISISELPDIDYGSDTWICAGDSKTLDAGSGFLTYQWNTGSTEQTIAVDQTGTYSVVVTDENSCSGSDEIELEFKPLPEITSATATNTLTGTLNGSIIVEATGSGNTLSYTLNDSITNYDDGTFEELSAGTYTVTVEEDECSVDTILTIEDIYIDLEFPLVFTPNDDGYNDEWTIDYITLYPTTTVQVYDRWSRLLYESSGSSYEPWDGTDTFNNREPLPEASYFYIIDLQDGTKPLIGYVSIIK